MSIFSELLKEPINDEVKKAIEEGAKPIGYTCSYVPDVILSAGGFLPIRLRAPGVAGTESADVYLTSTICSYTRSLLEFAMDGRYEELKGWVYVASCDHLRRLYDYVEYLHKPDFNYILDIPAKDSEHARFWLVEEFNKFRDSLSTCFGVEINDAALKSAISEYNQYISILKDIGDLRKNPNPRISGTEFHELMLAAVTTPRKVIIPAVKKLEEAIGSREGISDHRARLMVVGGQLDNPEYIQIIESQKGLVVADRLCTGSIPGLLPIDENKDPMEAIVEHTFKKTGCPRITNEYQGRLQQILDSVKEYDVDGVVIESIKFCDIWGYEAAQLVDSLRKKNIPVLRLEREYRLSNEGQIKTRVQAFLESMGK